MRIQSTGAALALSFLAVAARAQGGTARLEGTVTDSAHGRPLGGATVLITKNSPVPAAWYSVTTDDRGRYRLDTLVAGRYSVALWHPLLDSLQLMLPARLVELGEGQRAVADLWIPSGATIRAMSCPGVTLPPGTGVLEGRVFDADSADDRPLVGAVVAIRWSDLTINRTTLKLEGGEHVEGARTNADGQYRFCGLPTDTWLAVQVQRDSVGSVVLTPFISDTLGVAVLDMSLSMASARPLAAATDTTRAPEPRVLSGTASVSGTVVGETGQPLPGVQLRVLETAAAMRTDSSGHFSLTGLPAGTQLLEAKRVGYRIVQQPVQLIARHDVLTAVHLRRIVSLDSVLVVARRSRYREFERNRRNGFGRFLTEEDIEKRHAFEATDLLRAVNGFRVIGSGFDAKVYSSRGASLSGRGCETNVVIDGMQHQDINWVQPSDIGAMETYPGVAGAPVQYDSACGVIVIWTKR
ncbi:MAG: TonB-dependent receptor plug domain-containing protein [Gemmatimonadaceae bacterium]|nr:TonB-dependent receptor plug domain-containing protein [Gemmatimonadaceae bacterium]NUR34208.1 TonB-dependent receptor plug domain-containing protein [Gemmatimonadaceae bacterium]NUS33539.1 TonB-dependent receptor plug domain-containing protein [Gemmatimonadaceae bacterium]NUS47348.1 TonB-dependent receptor plug domain-containing protein [Gemmatimonadaceae bacterium]